MFQRAAFLTACLAFTGCASVVNDTTHPIKVETKTNAGQTVAGADCKLTNDAASVSMKSGETVNIRRSSADLDITCKHPDNPDATGRFISRMNAGMVGNILIGGGIGMVIDHSRGTAYTYPTWVQLVFGKALMFDRFDEKDGQPAPGKEAAAPK